VEQSTKGILYVVMGCTVGIKPIGVVNFGPRGCLAGFSDIEFCFGAAVILGGCKAESL
jgi:hypothetical protein